MTVHRKYIRIGLIYLTYLLLAAYLLILIKLILLKYLDISDALHRLQSGQRFRPYNIIPFTTIYSYYIYDSMPLWRRIGNVFGNIGIFMPLGLMLPVISHYLRRFWRSLLVLLLISIFFETMQYLLATGSADIDDVILNTLGGAVGFGIYFVLDKLIKHRNILLLSVLVIFMLMIVSGGWVAMREFRLDLGIYNSGGLTSPKQVPDPLVLIDETEWNIPARDRDNMGELIAINDSILSLNKFEINTHKHLDDTTRKTMTMVVTPHKKGNPALKYTLSDNTVYIRKDVKQFSSTDFHIQYNEGFRDSIPLRATVELWTLENGSMTIDTLCYWIKK